MNVDFHKSFDKQYKKLIPAQKIQFISALKIFVNDPTSQTLRIHPLKGKWNDYRSITAANDLRIHFRIIDEQRVLLVAVGTHAQLYR